MQLELLHSLLYGPGVWQSSDSSPSNIQSCVGEIFGHHNRLRSQGRDTYSRQYEGIGNLGVQRAWSEIMNVLVNPKGSVGRWNLDFWRLEQFYTNF
jgi:hypothetical protein